MAKISAEFLAGCDLNEEQIAKILQHITAKKRGDSRKYAIYLTKQQEAEIRELIPQVRLVLWNPPKS